MTWVIELDTEQIATGPLHGELLDVVTQAVEDYVPGYVTKSRIQWRVDDEPDGAPCCPDPACGGNPCTFPGYAANH